MKGVGEFSIGGQIWPGTSKLLEESGELVQVLGKLIGSHGDPAHYDGTDLNKRAAEEIADVLAAIEFWREQNSNAEADAFIEARRVAKLDLFRQWHRDGK